MLPLNSSAGTPSFRSIVYCRSVSGVCSGQTTWRPPLTSPQPPPTTRIGRFSVVWRFEFRSAPPYMIMMWSSSDPSPSGVSRILTRNSLNNCMWYALIFPSFSIFSGMSRWWLRGWCGSVTPICGYVAPLSSRAIINEVTRVMSV